MRTVRRSQRWRDWRDSPPTSWLTATDPVVAAVTWRWYLCRQSTPERVFYQREHTECTRGVLGLASINLNQESSVLWSGLMVVVVVLVVVVV